MRRGLAAGAALALALMLGACSEDEPDPGDPSVAPTDPLTQEQSHAALLTAEDFPLEGFERAEPAPVSTQVAVLDASALLDSDELTAECREAAELARATPPPQAGTSASFTSSAGGVDREVTLIVFSTPIPLDYLGGYADQAAACGTVEEGGRTLELSTLSTEGLRGYRLVTDLGGTAIDLVVAGRSVGPNHVVASGVGLTEEEAVGILDAQFANLPSGG